MANNDQETSKEFSRLKTKVSGGELKKKLLNRKQKDLENRRFHQRYIFPRIPRDGWTMCDVSGTIERKRKRLTFKTSVCAINLVSTLNSTGSIVVLSNESGEASGILIISP